MAETGTGNQVNGTETKNQERTFTQEEVDAIIQGRLAKERDKFSDYEDLKSKALKFDEIEEANKSELQKANEKANALQAKLDAIEKANNLSTMRSKIAEEMKVPSNLLTAEDEESCRAQAKSILEFAKPQNGVPDGGEVNSTGGTKTTRDQFAEAFVEAIGEK